MDLTQIRRLAGIENIKQTKITEDAVPGAATVKSNKDLLFYLVHNATDKSTVGDVLSEVDGESFALMFIGAGGAKRVGQEDWQLYHHKDKTKAVASAKKRLETAGSPYATKLDGVKIDESLTVPKSRNELAPKNRKNMEARVKQVLSAAKHLQQALTALEKIPAVDFMGDIPHFHHEIDQLLNGDDGEGGLANMITIFKTELNKAVRAENKKAREEEEAAYMMDDMQESMGYYTDTNIISHEKEEKPVNVVSAEKGDVFDRGEAKNDEDKPQKVDISPKVKSELKSASDSYREKSKRMIKRDKLQADFYDDVADAMDEVHKLLTGDISDFKEAQQFFQSLMSPIATNFPVNVVKLLAYSGQTRSLKNLFKEVKK